MNALTPKTGAAAEQMSYTLTAGNQAAGTNDLGFKDPLEWFPNLLLDEFPKGGQIFIKANTVADRDNLVGVADAQQFGIIVTYRKYSDNDPATGSVVAEEVSSAVATQNAATGNVIGPQSFVASFPRNFLPDSIGIQVVIPTTGTALSDLKLYAL